jgi:cytidine deaminase
MKNKINYKKIITTAFDFQKNAYAPYSNFSVGACVQTGNGKFFGGANIENSSYPCGICAERVAVSKAISEGESKFLAIAITSSGADYTYPCGLCRQFLSEFGNIKIIIAKSVTDYKEYDLCELLPSKFDKNSLN